MESENLEKLIKKSLKVKECDIALEVISKYLSNGDDNDLNLAIKQINNLKNKELKIISALTKVDRLKKSLKSKNQELE
jgi:hypothetical protein